MKIRMRKQDGTTDTVQKAVKETIGPKFFSPPPLWEGIT